MKPSNSILAGAFVLAVAGSVGANQAGTATRSTIETEMKAMDTNGDGKISPEEHAAGARRMFEAMDANKDGKVTAAEMDAAHERVTGQKAVKGEILASEKIKAIDTDGDGILTAEEHAAGAKKMFATMDANKDGKVTAAEMDAAHEKVTGHKASKGEMSAADKIKTIDTDHDGVLTAEEHEAGADRMFDMMDTNKDGYLSKAEFETGHAKMMAKPGAKK